MTYEGLADDVAALMDKINIPEADIFGFSLGAGVGQQLAIRYPEKVRHLAAVSGSYKTSRMYPELVSGFKDMTVDMLQGSSWEKEYLKIAPNKNDFPKLFEKLKTLDARPQNWPEEEIRNIKAPVLVVSGDSDSIRPEHSAEIFRLRSGGIAFFLAENSIALVI